MFIFGKKAKALIKRVEDLEYASRNATPFNQHKALSETTSIDIASLIKRVDANEGALKELALTVENLSNEPKKSPQQLLKEWFSGEEEGSA